MRQVRNLILGTAGHIDHGKTALVQALTGTNTDRLKEERERGITIELGFTELRLPGVRFGVVDVPGHEAFVRAMLAGAAGTDVVMLVVAADEAVMPQTREHLAIVDALGIGALVVALTKSDAVDQEWLELALSDVDDLLADTRYAAAERVPTSSITGAGLDELRDALARAVDQVDTAVRDDLARLPVDRVFSVAGAGTVVTGTVWGGTISRGDTVRLLPADRRARVRGLEVHGTGAEAAATGERAAVALVGEGADRASIVRGSTLVSDSAWRSTWMLTAKVTVFRESSWMLEHNQRVRVHLGTAEALARVALLGQGRPDPVLPGESAWLQIRLEEPMVARARDRLVVRSYSPVTSIAGGVVAEPFPAKRRDLTDDDRQRLEVIAKGDPASAVRSALAVAGWHGIPVSEMPLVTGLTPRSLQPALAEGVVVGTMAFSADVVKQASEMVSECVAEGHRTEPLRPVVPLAAVRTALPGWTPPALVQAAIDHPCELGRLEQAEGGIRLPGHRPRPTRDQEVALSDLRAHFRATGLAVQDADQLPAKVAARDDRWALLKHLESEGFLTALADGRYVPADALGRAVAELRRTLGGRSGLGPADFRDVLGISRRHLIPILNHFDGIGVTIREGDGRTVFGDHRDPAPCGGPHFSPT